ncbi:single-stranded DNA-binding protein [Flavobacterium sp. D11R37]|uniref:single-stranded DNA-binding protein n=1 Tax=Flavobacterium coralii TaxID=2838017 RepID=UPI001CA6393F|nr:single-stranded DNA-binding protein [Flavobacterium coralii]MBY8961801.1 single-stranded DNA-binding protein [Flavobacterium coralii]
MEITGRLTADAQVRTLSDNRQVVNFSVAVSNSYKARSGERITQTEFFDCAYWFSTGIAQYLTKGSLVELAGRVSARAWMGNDGQPKAGLNFNTTDIKLHGGSNKAETQAGQPQTEKQAHPVNQTAASAAPVYEAEILPNGAAPDDDLPF